MPGRRPNLKMSSEEIADFLASRCHIVLGTIGPAGVPHLVTVSYGLQQGRICFWGFAKSQKLANLRRDPRLTLLLEDPGESYGDIRGVQVTGTGILTDVPGEVTAIGELVIDSVARFRSLPTFGEQEGERLPASALADKRLGVWVEPVKIVSWDHSRLQGRY